MKIKHFALMSSLFIIQPAYAFAVVCVNCSTSAQQIQSNLKQAQEYIETVQQTVNSFDSLKNQAQQIQNQIRNLQKLDGHNWGNVMQQLDDLNFIARQGESMSFSLANLNDVWANRFRGMTGWENEVMTMDNMSTQYREWGRTLRDTAQSSLNVAAQISRVQQADENVIKGLEHNSSSAQGALQVAQAGNEIAAQTTRQIQKLQTLMQTDIQMTATSMAVASEKQEQQQAASKNLHKEMTIDHNSGRDWSRLY